MQEEIEAYISNLLDVPTGVKNVSDIIQFNIDHAELELIPPYYDAQEMCVVFEPLAHELLKTKCEAHHPVHIGILRLRLR